MRSRCSTGSLTDLPVGKGLPVVVRTGVYFVDLANLNENERTFTGTIDMRLRWTDVRLQYPAADAPQGFKEWRGAAAEAKTQEIWVPDVALTNLEGEPSFQSRGLRSYPDGRLEMMQRTTGTFSIPLDVERFPFDRQKLMVELACHGETLQRVRLDFQQDDLTFSRAAASAHLSGWTVGLVEVKREAEAGWYGEAHSRLAAALEVARSPGTTVAPIFIPLFASLLIPLLAMWLNRNEAGEFQIEAFELSNIIIGGLFAVIALNFTVDSTFEVLGSGDNMVTRLFGLNYLTLGVSLVINILLFRFNVVRRAFGKYVQEQLYLYLVWAVPVLALVCAVALILVAKV